MAGYVGSFNENGQWLRIHFYLARKGNVKLNCVYLWPNSLFLPHLDMIYKPFSYLIG